MPFPTKPVSFGSKAECGLVALMELASSYATGLILRVTEIANRLRNAHLSSKFSTPWPWISLANAKPS